MELYEIIYAIKKLKWGNNSAIARNCYDTLFDFQESSDYRVWR